MSLFTLASAASQILHQPKDVKDASVCLMNLSQVAYRVQVPDRKVRVRKAFVDASKGLIDRFSATTMEDLHFLAKHSDCVGLYYLKLAIVYITKLSGAINPERSFSCLSKFIGTVDQTFASQPSLYRSVCFVRKCFKVDGGEYAELGTNLIDLYLRAPCVNYRVASEF